MGRALARAREVLGTTAPNPSVGAVILRGDEVLGEGATQPCGGPHAEVMALRDAAARGHDVRGATMCVTLEPCCHHGRTPPCTQALLDAGIGRVVIGVTDPHPLVRGKGIQELRDAGVDVQIGVARQACADQILGFARSVVRGLPEVTVKVAASLDGRLATASGESQWITSEEARAHGRLLRATHDAILVGRGTVDADDPRLTVRVEGAVDPVPVVLDTELRARADARLFQSERTVVVCAHDAPDRRLGVARIVRVPRGDDGRVELESALRGLVSLGLHRVLVEGGGQVVRSFVDARLYDTLRVYLAGCIVPGGRSWVGGPPLEHLGDAPRLELVSHQTVGVDLCLTWRAHHRHSDPLAELEG
jgi:diaminohydroxyphosphoribosylaminopyrimidine deaminase/5-amino-6-(5-phosphoribosylamino)uracil reductase